MTQRLRLFSIPLLGTLAMIFALLAPSVGQAEQAAEEHNVFFGWLLGTTDLAAVALDVGAVDDAGMIPVLAYVCDGLGNQDGMAVWFKGEVERDTIGTSGVTVDFTSPTGEETLNIGHLGPYDVRGTYTGPDGQPHRFAAFRAVDGAGIYDVTLDEDLHYAGTSTDGNTLSADVLDDGHVAGTITTVDGEAIAFYIATLALTPPEQLAALALPETFPDYAEQSVIPGTYVAVISPGGAFWLGRNGDVRGGNPGNNIIGLDAAD